MEGSQSDTFSNAELYHKRGAFPAVNFGFTLPNGYQAPIQLDHSRHVDKVERIQASAGFKQISCLQNGGFHHLTSESFFCQSSHM